MLAGIRIAMKDRRSGSRALLEMPIFCSQQDLINISQGDFTEIKIQGSGITEKVLDSVENRLGRSGRAIVLRDDDD